MNIQMNVKIKRTIVKPTPSLQVVRASGLPSGRSRRYRNEAHAGRRARPRRGDSAGRL